MFEGTKTEDGGGAHASRELCTAEEYHQKYLDKNPGGYCHIPRELLDLHADENQERTGRMIPC